MDTNWDFRAIYEEARLVKIAQDEWCASAEAGAYEGLAKYPATPIKVEMLVETLRGQVLVNAHCVSRDRIPASFRLLDVDPYPLTPLDDVESSTRLRTSMLSVDYPTSSSE
jgi:hypothetical protein